jgi:hypothetical protein
VGLLVNIARHPLSSGSRAVTRSTSGVSGRAPREVAARRSR